MPNKPVKGIRLLTDNPLEPTDARAVRHDGLDFDFYADVLARAALGTSTPFTIGVFGEWGTGKTSLMHMVKAKLDEEENTDTVTVWFDAWRYEQDQHPIVPLIATIIRALESEKTVLEKLADEGHKLKTALRAVACGFSIKAVLGDSSTAHAEAGWSVKDVSEGHEKLTADTLLDSSLYYGAFERLSKIDLSKSVRIVVLIDDLDRCFPNRAIKLLESIKLVLAQPGFVFILGVSQTVLEGYLEHRYKHRYGLAEFDGRSYLDKIVQLPFPIPPHRDRMQSFSAALLGELHASDAKELKDILPIIGAACASNPRTTVRFVNNLLIDKEINRSLVRAKRMQEAIPIGYFAVTRSLQQRWPDIFSRLTASSELCLILSQVSRETLHELPKLPEDIIEPSLAARLTEELPAVVPRLLGNADLQELLYSQQGRAWLAEADLRKAAIQFLRTTRQETPREPGWVLLVYDEGDADIAKRVFDLLSGLGIDVRGMRAGAVKWRLEGAVALVWLLGSNWQLWEQDEALVRLLLQLPQRHFLVRAEAQDSNLPARLANAFTIPLPDKDISLDDIEPLFNSLADLTV